MRSDYTANNHYSSDGTRLILVLFAVACYLPIFGRVVPGLSTRQETFLNYGIPLAVLAAIAAVAFRGLAGLNSGLVESRLKWVMIFLTLYVGLWIVKGVLEDHLSVDSMRILRNKVAGPIYGICLLFVLGASTDSSERKSKATTLLYILVFCFMGQLTLSLYESQRGQLLGKYEMGNIGSLEGRDLMAQIRGSEKNPLGFSIPFTGQIGQHNAFGNMLALYNCAFLLLLVGGRRKLGSGLIILTLFALLGNATRVALLSALVADMIVFISLYTRGSLRKLFVVGGLLVIAALLCFWWEDFLRLFLAKSNTIPGRLLLWDIVWKDISTNLGNPLYFLFGPSIHDLGNVGLSFRGRALGSFENQFLALFVDSGIIGLVLFIVAFLVVPVRLARTLPLAERNVAWAYVLTIFLCGLTLDLHLHFSSIGVLLTVYYSLYARSVKGSEPPESQLIQEYALAESNSEPVLPIEDHSALRTTISSG